MAMGWAAKEKKLRQHPVRTIAARYEKAGSFKTRYWTPEVHVAAFALPRFGEAGRSLLTIGCSCSV